MKEDWIECELGDLLKLKNGYAFKSSQYKNTGIPVIRIGDIQDWLVDSIKAKRIEENEEYDNYTVSRGDVLIAMSGATTGKFGVYKSYEKAYQNQRVGNLIPHSDKFLDKNYIYYLLYSLKRDIEQQAYGGAQPNISATKIEALKTKLFPLHIQKAIVKKIETLFSDLDQGIADLKKAQDQLKIYRQALLSSSFPKKEKIEISKLVGDLSQGWSPKCINKNSTDINEWAVIKTSAIQSGKFVECENKILPNTLEPKEQHEIKKGDILITRAGPRVRVGICCLVRKTRPKLINCDKVYRIKLNKELVTPEYFEYVLNSPEILSEIEIMKSGSSDSGLNLTQKTFLKLEIPIPSLKQQHQIVKEIESRLSVCDVVEQNISESLEKAKALRQSILKKAFEGKLLSEEEIAQCKAQPGYEPASVLLEKIKKEKNKK